MSVEVAHCQHSYEETFMERRIRSNAKLTTISDLLRYESEESQYYIDTKAKSTTRGT